MKSANVLKNVIMIFSVLVNGSACKNNDDLESHSNKTVPVPEYSLTTGQTHNKFSRLIPPVIKVPSGAIVEAYTKEASDEQITQYSTTESLDTMIFNSNLVHPLTGPVFVEGAEPGDVLEVILHKIEIGDWGWTRLSSAGILGEIHSESLLKIFKLGKDSRSVQFNENIVIPLKPFPGVLGVAPDTDEMLSTIPPRANGGNMDDPNITEGTKVYFPVFVEGALFSIGDAHAAQGHGEVCGTAIEAPMRFIFELNVIKGHNWIHEPQYETDEYYAVTAFGSSLDIAAKKATKYMVDYLVSVHELTPGEAYMLCSLAGDLKIAEVVDRNMLVTMHMSKSVLGIQ